MGLKVPPKRPRRLARLAVKGISYKRGEKGKRLIERGKGEKVKRGKGCGG
jgi:hypothetical protein